MTPEAILRDAISMWWMRPENGLAIASYCLRGVSLAASDQGLSADYACGDGVSTFFKCGGRLSTAFDVFTDAVRDLPITEAATLGVDVFDHFDDAYRPEVVRTPDAPFTFGLDHKQALLDKAGRLPIYDERLCVALEDDPPIADGSLALAYCNSLYWTERPERAVELIYRKLRPGGRAVFDVMTTDRRRLDFDLMYPALPEGWRGLLNRGRQHNNPGLRTEAEWTAMFAAGGAMRIDDVRSIFPTAIATAWTFGMRPLMPALKRLVSHVPPAERAEAKAEWVDTWTRLLLPLLVEPEAFAPETLRVRLQYVMHKEEPS